MKQLTKAEVASIDRAISFVLRSWALSREDKEDMRAAAWIVIMRRLPRFDSSQARLTTWAEHCAKSACMDYYRENYTPRESKRPTPLEIALLIQHLEEKNAPVHQPEAPELPPDLFDDFDDRDMTIIRGFMRGTTLAEIAVQIGVTESRVSQKLKRLLQQLKQRLISRGYFT